MSGVPSVPVPVAPPKNIHKSSSKLSRLPQTVHPGIPVHCDNPIGRRTRWTRSSSVGPGWTVDPCLGEEQTSLWRSLQYRPVLVSQDTESSVSSTVSVNHFLTKDTSELEPSRVLEVTNPRRTGNKGPCTRSGRQATEKGRERKTLFRDCFETGGEQGDLPTTRGSNGHSVSDGRW